MRILARLPLVIVAFLASSAAQAQPEVIDHYLCHRVQAYDGPASIPVKLKDQFGRMAARAGKPQMLCNPVDKNENGIRTPDAHLLCYNLTNVEGAPSERKVLTETQFGKTTLTVRGLEILCVPASKELQ